MVNVVANETSTNDVMRAVSPLKEFEPVTDPQSLEGRTKSSVFVVHGVDGVKASEDGLTFHDRYVIANCAEVCDEGVRIQSGSYAFAKNLRAREPHNEMPGIYLAGGHQITYDEPLVIPRELIEQGRVERLQ